MLMRAGLSLLLGEEHRNNNTRLMCATAIRIEQDLKGNFKDTLWVFAQTLGGPPDLRDVYPTNNSRERFSAGS